MKPYWQQASSGYSRRISTKDFVRFDSKAQLTLSAETYERLGCPAAVQVFYDAVNRRLGLKAANILDTGAFHVGLLKSRKTARVCIYRVVNQFSLKIPAPTRFEDPILDEDGILILDLATGNSEQRVSG